LSNSHDRESNQNVVKSGDDVSIFNRVLTSIKRYKGRTFVLLMTVFLVGFFISGSMLINHAIDVSIQQLQRTMPLVFSIVYDENTTLDLEQYSHGIDEEFILLDREMIHEIGSLSYVSHYDYTIYHMLRGYYQPYWLEETNMGCPDEWPHFTFRIHGVSHPEIIYIESGMYELYAGRLFTAEEVQPVFRPEVAPALVSRELTELNGLSIGTIVQLTQTGVFYLPEDARVPEGGFTGMYWGEALWEHPYSQIKDIIYDFEIIGIFEFTRNVRGNASDLVHHQCMTNLFFTPNWRVEEVIRNQVDGWLLWADVFNMHDWEDGVVELFQAQADAITPLWVLYDVDDIMAFKEAANRILPPHVIIDDGLIGTFRPIIETTNQLNATLNRVLWMGAGAMIIVLTLLILLYLRERKHELGIYMALGERKIKVVCQIVLEVFLVSVIGLILTLFITHIMAESVSRSMIQSELFAAATRCESYWPSMLEMLGFGQELTVDEMLEHFNVSLDARTIFLFFVASIGAIIASTVVPVVYILELNPKDILMKGRVE